MAGWRFEIHIKGHLSLDWADWLDSLQMICLENGESVLCGVLADQTALLGILNKLNYLNLCILSVNVMELKDTYQNVCGKNPNETEGEGTNRRQNERNIVKEA